jgi:hypothetical protein
MNSLFWVSYGVLWVIVCALIVLILLVYRQFGLMIMPGSQRISYAGLDIGARAPALPLRMNGGTEQAYNWSTTLPHHVPQVATVAIFALPSCPVCESLAREEEVGALVNIYPSILFMWVSGRPDESHPAPQGWIEASSHHGHAHNAMEIPGTPFAYVVSADSTIRSKGVVNSSRDIELLIADGKVRGTERIAVSVSAENYEEDM